jgi:hypothetical protein
MAVVRLYNRIPLCVVKTVYLSEPVERDCKVRLNATM